MLRMIAEKVAERASPPCTDVIHIFLGTAEPSFLFNHLTDILISGNVLICSTAVARGLPHPDKVLSMLTLLSGRFNHHATKGTPEYECLGTVMLLIEEQLSRPFN